MKRFIFIVIAIFALAGCAGDQYGAADTRAIADNASKNLPSIPKPKPSIPNTKVMQANLLASVDLQNTQNSYKEPNMERLVGEINKNLEQVNITATDIERGWYYGEKTDKKTGTPSSWIWVEDRVKSRWMSPNASEEISDIQIDEICQETDGYFIISCIERVVSNCEYVAKSECRCSADTKWVDDQGCIMTDEDDQFIKINSEELMRGWYYGFPNQKKLNTPVDWTWMENGRKSKWKNPS